MSRKNEIKKVALKDLSVKKVVKGGIAWGGPTMVRKAGEDQEDLRCRKAGGDQQVY